MGNNLYTEENYIQIVVTNFINGLCKKANIEYISNCYLCSCILQEYLWLIGVDSNIVNCKVKQGRKKVNHFYLITSEGFQIDPTASQFKDITGKRLPKILFDNIPEFYILND